MTADTCRNLPLCDNWQAPTARGVSRASPVQSIQIDTDRPIQAIRPSTSRDPLPHVSGASPVFCAEETSCPQTTSSLPIPPTTSASTFRSSRARWAIRPSTSPSSTSRRVTSLTTPDSSPRPAPRAQSPLSTAIKACCSIEAIRLNNWPSSRIFSKSPTC